MGGGRTGHWSLGGAMVSRLLKRTCDLVGVW
jgi:hypothetical protein